MKFDYNSLNYAGTENYRSARRPVIEYPGTETVEWYGFKRHNFEIDGHKGFIVEPPNPAPGLPRNRRRREHRRLAVGGNGRPLQNTLRV